MPMHTIDQPLRRPHRYGLTSVWVATDLPEASATTERPFVHGVQWRGDQTVDPHATEAGCVADFTANPTAIVTDVPVMDGEPFGLRVVDRCSNVGSRAIEESRRRAQRQHSMSESFGIETVLATGASVLTRHFEDDATVDTSAGVHGPARTIGRIEAAYFAAEKMLGTLHVPLAAMQLLATAGTVTLTDGRWRTAAGSYVAFGAGYPGNQPDGATAAADTTWVYYTGDVHAHRDPLETLESWGNPSHDNARLTYAQRQYVVVPDGETWLGSAMSLVAE